MDSGNPPRRGWVLAAVVAAVVLLAYVAGSGSVRLFSDPPPAAGTPRERSESPAWNPMQRLDETLGAPPTVGGTDWTWVTNILTAVVFAALVWVALLAVRALWRRRWRRAKPLPTISASPLPSVAEAVTQDAAAHLAALEEGEPRNAIVACWQTLEESIRAAGVTRQPAETAAEFTERVLAELPVDRAMLSGFAELYREARFSQHPMGERARRGAQAALRSLHGDLAELSLQEARHARTTDGTEAAAAGAPAARS